MPTELPQRRVEPPKSSRTGNLVTLVAVLLMFGLSIALLRQSPDAAAPAETAQAQGL